MPQEKTIELSNTSNQVISSEEVPMMGTKSTEEPSPQICVEEQTTVPPLSPAKEPTKTAVCPYYFFSHW